MEDNNVAFVADEADAGDRAGPFDGLAWRNRFAALPPAFYTRLPPSPLPEPYLVAASDSAAALLGLDRRALASSAGIAVLAGNRVPRGADPLAEVYSGHQFGVWAGQLGDGRAHLLGDVVTPDGPLELQLKGSGRTPYSRMGDGRAVLRSSIREFLCSEAMHGLGIPTTRALAVAGSDQPVIRETVETAATVLRMAPSFVRFGSFEHWFSRNEYELLRTLADLVIDDFYPECREAKNPYAALLEAVAVRSARLVAQWQAVGFCHGVMNTDNMSILGLTLDYGPFGFLDAFDANHICNHTDERGRYAYARQPSVMRWNVHCLAEALLPLIESVDDAETALATFQPTFIAAMDDAMHAKLGLIERKAEDQQLLGDLFGMLQDGRIDFTLFFRRLADFDRADGLPGRAPRDLFLPGSPAAVRFERWTVDYRARLAQESSQSDPRQVAMRAANPKYILRNHLAETAITRARTGDFSEVDRLCHVLARPFDEQPEHDRDADLPPDWAASLEVSCSS
jgi:serine/tyrosine/threonine adenylyltransferase